MITAVWPMLGLGSGLHGAFGSSASVLGAGAPDRADLERIRTRKPEAPMIEVTLKDGSHRKLWCTFGEDHSLSLNGPLLTSPPAPVSELASTSVGSQQIDLDPFSPSGEPLKLGIRFTVLQSRVLRHAAPQGQSLSRSPSGPCVRRVPS